MFLQAGIFHRAPIIAGPREPKLALGEINWNEKLTLPWISIFRPSYFKFSVFEPACRHPATSNIIGCRGQSPVPVCHNTRSSQGRTPLSPRGGLLSYGTGLRTGLVESLVLLHLT